MMHSQRQSKTRRHVDTRAALDYLDGLLSALDQQHVEEHLAGPCQQCRETMRDVGPIVTVMRADRTPPVPASARARALSVFVPRPAVRRTRRSPIQVARLLFDSLLEPLPAAARRAVGDARRLRF